MKQPGELVTDSGSESRIGISTCYRNITDIYVYVYCVNISFLLIGCPELSDLPNTMFFNGENRFLCAKVYTGFGGKYPVNSCNG